MVHRDVSDWRMNFRGLPAAGLEDLRANGCKLPLALFVLAR